MSVGLASRVDDSTPGIESGHPAGPRSSHGQAAWLLPFLAFVLIFGAYPLVQCVRMAFSEVEIQQGQFGWTWNGLTNFRTVLSDPESWNVLTNTVVFVSTVTVGSIVLGIAAAVLVDRATLLQRFAENVLVWPAIITPVVISLMWLLILSPTSGGLNKLLETVGLPGQGWLNSELGAMLSVIVVDIWHWTPVVFLFVYTALKSFDDSVVEAARVDGANERQIFFRILLPMLAPTLAAVAIVRVIMSVKAFDEMYLLTAGGPNGATTLVSQEIRDTFFTALEFGQASAYGLLVMVLTIVLVAAMFWMRSAVRRLG